MVFRSNLFFKELMMFCSTLLLGVLLAHNFSLAEAGSIPAPVNVSWDYSFIFLGVFVVLSLLFMRFKSFNKIFLRLFLVLVVFSGSNSIFNIFLGFPWGLLSSLLLVTLFLTLRNVFVHDLCMIFGLAGVAGILGISFSPELVIGMLVALSFYDIIAVYWTKHMVYMARGMMESGAIFGFIIPFYFSDFFSSNDEAGGQFGDKFMVLGSGDIALPAVMASSVAVYSVPQALIIGVFSMFGLLLTHLIFINQKERKPMAALPPIATLTIIGYLASLIIL